MTNAIDVKVNSKFDSINISQLNEQINKNTESSDWSLIIAIIVCIGVFLGFAAGLAGIYVANKNHKSEPIVVA
jgi:hypothetical protein